MRLPRRFALLVTFDKGQCRSRSSRMREEKQTIEKVFLLKQPFSHNQTRN
jgi:hypothetical protein